MKKRDNIPVKTSICLIKKIWHGKFGRDYNKKHRIICRFHPSCSNYAIMALEKHGFVRGWFKTIERIKRCNPENCDTCIDFP